MIGVGADRDQNVPLAGGVHIIGRFFLIGKNYVFPRECAGEVRYGDRPLHLQINGERVSVEDGCLNRKKRELDRARNHSVIMLRNLPVESIERLSGSRPVPRDQAEGYLHIEYILRQFLEGEQVDGLLM